MADDPKALDTAVLEEDAEDLYESAPCGYLSTLLDGTIVKVNHTLLELTGYDRAALVGTRRFQDLLTIGSKVYYETHFAPLMQMQGTINQVSLELVRQDRRRVPILVNAVQKCDAAGSARFVRISVLDVTDRREYEREILLARKKAEQAAQAKADFLSMISHEIRTPLNAIIGVAFLLEKVATTPPQQKYVRILRSSSENLLNLINDVLDFSRIEAGKVTLEQRSFDLRHLVYNIVFGLNVKAEEKRLQVHIDVDEQVPSWLVGDPTKIGQVITNLVGNAIKFTQQGWVRVKVALKERHPDAVTLAFSVTDTGIGIPADRLAHIFEEFTQASTEIGVKYGGSGLGLAISRKLLELHGSRMNVESEPGRGSTFAFDLRLTLGDRADDAAASDSERRALEGIRVLVAEDNQINVFVLSRFLRRWGVEFDVVDNGEKAVERVQASEYDLVLMDLQMPQLDGYEAARRIRQLDSDRLRRLPIIAISASTRIGQESRIDTAGFTDFIGKPFDPDMLYAKIARHVATRAAGDANATSAVGADAPAARARGNVAAALPEFSLEELKRQAGDDRAALVELCRIAQDECRRHRDAFERALEHEDLRAFEFEVHKIKTTLKLLQAHALWAALREGAAALDDLGRDPDRLHAARDAITRELDAIVDAIERELEPAA